MDIWFCPCIFLQFSLWEVSLAWQRFAGGFLCLAGMPIQKVSDLSVCIFQQANGGRHLSTGVLGKARWDIIFRFVNRLYRWTFKECSMFCSYPNGELNHEPDRTHEQPNIILMPCGGSCFEPSCLHTAFCLTSFFWLVVVPKRLPSLFASKSSWFFSVEWVEPGSWHNHTPE